MNKPLTIYVLNLFDCGVTLWFFFMFGISIESNPFGVALLQKPDHNIAVQSCCYRSCATCTISVQGQESGANWYECNIHCLFIVSNISCCDDNSSIKHFNLTITSI